MRKDRVILVEQAAVAGQVPVVVGLGGEHILSATIPPVALATHCTVRVCVVAF